MGMNFLYPCFKKNNYTEKMEVQKFYTIQVGGPVPADVLYGFLNKDTMQPDLEVNTVIGKIQLGGVSMPNYSKVWGARELKDGKATGKLIFLKWGSSNAPKGYENPSVIEVRYLPNSNSLDKQYQDLVQKIKIQDEDTEIHLILGINKFDYKDKGMLIEMLKIHTFNADSPCRDPNNTNVQYLEYNPSDRIKSKSRSINTRRLAEEYVMNCEGAEEGTFDEKLLANLAHVFELNAQDTNEILYNTLLDKASENPEHFILVLQTKRDTAKRELILAQEHGFVDFETEGEINLRDGSKKINLVKEMGTELTAEDKINLLVQNFTLPEYYESICRIQAKVKEFQTLQLQ